MESNLTVAVLNNASAASGGPTRQLWEVVALSLVLGLIILVMVIGNLFVILAILLERDLQRPQYYLIGSLGVADLLVGVLVSPLASVFEIQMAWNMGTRVCDFWVSMDVLACTSSILHLVAIALDRYWSITDIQYMQKRTPKRICIMLLVVWIVSLLVSVPPLLGWKDDGFEHRVMNQSTCLISQDLGYQAFSTLTAFYLPLILIIVVYWNIFKAAKRRIRKTRERRASNTALESKQAPTAAVTTIHTANATTNTNDTNVPTRKKTSSVPHILKLSPMHASNSRLLAPKAEQEESPSFSSEADVDESEASVEVRNGAPVLHRETVLDSEESEVIRSKSAIMGNLGRVVKTRKSKESPEALRERKAFRTLAIITGTFVGCWLPFFLLAVARPICSKAYANTTSQAQASKCAFPKGLESFFLWLGYLNSALNPVIYTIFSPDFRQAFKKILQKLCFL